MMHTRPTLAPKSHNRRGSIMTLWAVLLFAFLPLVALIIHTGMITLTRRQMQTAVNTAALDALRGSPRSDVSTLARLVFDDDLDKTPSPSMILGAGPDVPMSGGIELTPDSDFRASRKIDAPGAEGYQGYLPDLQTNSTNLAHGDMLAGRYVEGGDHTEEPDYSRLGDFVPNDPNSDAFLVRMRRTGGGGMDEQDTISSSGPGVPFLFGRLPYGNADGGTDLLDQRERGTIVRATAIARAQPAKSAGPSFSVPGLDIEGVTNVVVESSFWTTWVATGTADVTLSGIDLQVGPTRVGQLVDASAIVEPLTIGQLESDLNDATLGAIPEEMGIVVIVDDVADAMSGTEKRIVGFGWLETVTESGGVFTLTNISDHLLLWNASASFLSTSQLYQGNDPNNGLDVDLDDLMGKHMDLAGTLKAPALARAIP